MKQLLLPRRVKRMRTEKRQGQLEPSLLEKLLLQSLRIDHRGKRKQPLGDGPQKLRL